MAAQPAVAPASAGGTVTEVAGSTIGTDTFPAGCCILMRNTGAGSHTVTIVCNATTDGLTTTSRAIVIAAAGIRIVRIPAIYGDANGQVSIGVDAAPTEMKFYVIGA